jgi:hypothetical protein
MFLERQSILRWFLQSRYFPPIDVYLRIDSKFCVFLYTPNYHFVFMVQDPTMLRSGIRRGRPHLQGFLIHFVANFNI